MEKFLLYSKYVHILCGSLALLSGLGAIIFRNKVKVHKPFGKIYFWSMTIIFVTSFYLSLYKQMWFLFFISVFTYHACITGFRSLKLKKLHIGQKPRVIDWIIEVANISVNLGLIGLAVYFFSLGGYQGGFICLAFGLIGIRGSMLNIKRLRGFIIEKNYWLISHITGMLGSYIGAITAFTVNNNRWMHLPEIVVWLGPTILLVPLIVYEVRKRKIPLKATA